MVFVLGVVLLGAGILVLRTLAPKIGNQPAFMKRPPLRLRRFSLWRLWSWGA